MIDTNPAGVIPVSRLTDRKPKRTNRAPIHTVISTVLERDTDTTPQLTHRHNRVGMTTSNQLPIRDRHLTRRTPRRSSIHPMNRDLHMPLRDNPRRKIATNNTRNLINIEHVRLVAKLHLDSGLDRIDNRLLVTDTQRTPGQNQSSIALRMSCATTPIAGTCETSRSVFPEPCS